MNKLHQNFYLHHDVTKVAQKLLGKKLVTDINGVLTSGIITETEAYSWKEKACHAYNNKRTNRTEVLFATGGCAYVYLCYGMHEMFNVVTNKKDIAEAVLIRGIKPLDGMSKILKRRNTAKETLQLANGPGKVTECLGITRLHNKIDLAGDTVWIEDYSYNTAQMSKGKRIGIDYAEEDADLLWRFWI